MKTKFHTILLSLSLLIQSSFGVRYFNSPSELPQSIDEQGEKVEYDFVIAGGGTAGSVVATRLAERHPEWSILVIEAGPSPNDILATKVPGLWTSLMGSPLDWNYTSIPQDEINGRTIDYSRAKMLGGCSSHNAMLYTRGSREDWNRYADIAGDESLTWDKMLPLFKKAEHLTQPLPSDHYTPSAHSTNGKIGVSAPYSNITFNELLLQAIEEPQMRDQFPVLRDMNEGRVIGTGWDMLTIENVERSSAFTEYIDKAGDNVHVVLNARVMRAVPASHSSSPVAGKKILFRGVEIIAEPGPTTSTSGTQPTNGGRIATTTLIAKKEIIVSGGVIGSPLILMHSGIGDKRDLEKVGVKALVHNPSVGRNVSDHIGTDIGFATSMPSNDFDQEAALEEWKKTKTGPLSQPITMNQLTWVRFQKNASLFSQVVEDPTGGEDSPHVEFSYTTISSTPPASTQPGPEPQFPPGVVNVTIQFAVVNLHPASRGSITLASSNPFDYPLIDFGLFKDPNGVDLAIAREGIRTARWLFGTASAFKGHMFGTVFPDANVTSDEDLDIYIRRVSKPFLHGVGSAAMSARGASWGVVDPDYKVKGTEGLRVVDASVIPLTPSAHTQVPVYGVAERASVLIAGAWE